MSRFDWRYELASIERGMTRDLQQPVGQTISWWVFDSRHQFVDDLYDVGSIDGGRIWREPLPVNVLSAIKYEANEEHNMRGLYLVDTLSVVLSVSDARAAGLDDLVFNPDAHVLDRIVYEGKVFGIDQVRTRGMVTADYAVIAVDAVQVKAEEMVNDPQFSQFLIGDVITIYPGLDVYPGSLLFPQDVSGAHPLSPGSRTYPSLTTYPLGA